MTNIINLNRVRDTKQNALCAEINKAVDQLEVINIDMVTDRVMRNGNAKFIAYTGDPYGMCRAVLKKDVADVLARWSLGSAR
jgi:hypothetical protein